MQVHNRDMHSPTYIALKCKMVAPMYTSGPELCLFLYLH